MWFSGKRAAGLAGIGIFPDGICVARVRRETGRRPVVEAYEMTPLNGEEPAKVLTRVTRQSLKHTRCVTVLNPSDYKLILTEAPDVRAQELRSALRWRVKDLIDFHVNDATLDAFELPEGNRGAGGRSMFVVVAENRLVRARVDLMDTAGVELEAIDIPELAQRNIAALTPEDAVGTAFLSLTESSGLVTITRQGELYFSRTLDIGRMALTGTEPEAAFDRLVLEIQRSLDYFDSHFRQSPVAHLLLDPQAASVAGLTERIAASVNVKTKVLALGEIFEWPGRMPPTPALAVLGAALRDEEVVL